MVRIPSEYQEVEYIESTGTQYILTDFVPKFLENEEYYMQFAYTDDRKTQIFFGGNSKYTTFQGVAIESGSPRIFGLRPSDNCSTYSGTAPFGINEWIDFFIANNTLTCKEASGTIRGTIHNNRLKLVLFGKGEETLTLSSMKLSCVYYKRDGETVLNLIPCYRKSDNEPGMYDTVSKQFYTNNGTGTFLKGNDVTYDNINLLESRRRILLNTPHIETVSDTIASFKTDVATKLKGCKIHFTPIQEGEGDPSPENVRPITGWDGVTVTRCGKNLFDRTGEAVGRFINSGGTSINSNGWSHSDYIPIKGGQTYIFNPNTTAGDTAKHILYDSAKGYIGYLNSGETIFIAPDNACFIRFSYRTASENIQLELGSTATAYEPYSATTLTIPFPQTIYGGYVDLAKGEVVEEIESFQIDGSETGWRELGSGENNHRMDIPISKLNGSPKYGNTFRNAWVSDKFYYKSGNNNSFGTFVFYYDASLVSPVNGTDLNLDTFKEWLSSNRPNFCGKLINSIHHSIDPQTLKALRGMNNIWSDANGNIEVSFYTH